MGRFTGILGYSPCWALAYTFSTNRRAIRGKTVAWGLGLQVAFAIFVLKIDFGRTLFQKAGDAVNRLLSYAFAGSQFVFGDLGKQGSHLGFYFAFQVLPTVIFICALFAVLYYFGVMQLVINAAAWLMIRLMGVSGAESLNVAASIFMGQTEAPQTIRPFLPDLTYSELMTVMTSGMAHVSGSIMAAYIAFGIEPKHLLSAVIMTAPGTLVMAKMLVPETEVPKTAGRVVMSEEETELEKKPKSARRNRTRYHRWFAHGAEHRRHADFVPRPNRLVRRNHGRNSRPHRLGSSSLEAILGALFAPIAWVIGVPWHDCRLIGNLLGVRMVLNELVAFSMLGPQKAVLDPRSFTIATFALCGFANFSSIGIQMGGIGALAPNKKRELAKLGIRAMLAGTMANLMSASIAGMLLS